MSDEFFKHVDNQVATISAEQKAKDDQFAANKAFAAKKIAESGQVAREYAAKLKERGVTASIDLGAYSLVFELRWANGHRHNIQLTTDHDTNRLMIHNVSTDYTDGRTSRSTDWQSWDESNWKEDTFTSALENSIHAYLSNASKHGGLA